MPISLNDFQKQLDSWDVSNKSNPTEGMSNMEMIRAAVGKFISDNASGLSQRGSEFSDLVSGNPQTTANDQLRRQQNDQTARLDQPLMATTPGKIGYTGAAVASSLPGAFIKSAGLIPGITRSVLSPQTVDQAVMSGGLQGAMQPTGSGDSMIGNALQGGQLGFMGGVLGQLPSRVLSPMQGQGMRRQMLDAGLVPTPGQAADPRTLVGKIGSAAEEKAQSLPIVGDTISYARNRTAEDLNLSALKEAGYTGKDIGTDAISQTHKDLGSTFKSLASRTTAKLDQPFLTDLQNVISSNDLVLKDDAKKVLYDKLGNLINQVKNGDELSGEAYNKFRGEWSEAGRKLLKAPPGADRDLGIALLRMSDALDSTMQRQSPALASEWGDARQKWSNLMRIEQAVSNSRNENGIFTPNSLASAISTRAGASQIAQGKAPMQNLAEIGMALKNRVPNSGSVDRALLGGGLLSGAYMSGMTPELMAGGAATTAAYGAKPITRYLVGGYPMQENFSLLRPPALVGGVAQGLQGFMRSLHSGASNMTKILGGAEQ